MTTKEEVAVFSNSIQELAGEGSPLLQDKEKVEQYRRTKERYLEWRKAVSRFASDIGEYRRMSSEITLLEETVSELESTLNGERQELEELGNEHADLATETTELRGLSDTTRRWVEDANRIATKKFRIGQKMQDLSMSMTGANSNRDLRTVERDLEDKREQKDGLMSKIQKLNKEFTALNQLIAQLTQQVRPSLEHCGSQFCHDR